VPSCACVGDKSFGTRKGGKKMRSALVFGVLILVSGTAYAQSTSDDDYIKKVTRAAPPQIVEQSSIVRMDGSTMKTLRKGASDWTCMEGGGVPMCLDPNAMEWAHAWQSHGTPTTKTGFIYMLAGDDGASNTDPWAKAKTADNHWVVTGPHVMIVGAAAPGMVGYAKSPEADPSKPYVMWPGSPYEHLMIPVK
jgi:hypothetical protein